MINANGDIVGTMNWSSTSAAVLKLSPTYDARRALEIVIPASFAGAGAEADAKGITIDNASDSISIDITDGGSTAMNIAGAAATGILLTHSGTGAGIDISGAADLPLIEIAHSSTATSGYGMRITASTGALKDSIFIDNNGDSQVTRGMYIDRDGNANSQIVVGLRVDADNAGTGTAAAGISFNGGSAMDAIIQVAADATDPTDGGGAATGRIPIYVGSTKKYLAYY